MRRARFSPNLFPRNSTPRSRCASRLVWRPALERPLPLGPATEVAGYDLSAGCLVTNNIALSAPPFFVSTKLESPHFCRPAMRNGDWAGKGYAWTNEGEYPDWIGARPAWVPELYRTLLILR